ncbi:hypothetical protein ACQ4LE_006690 [Meloidogyne hapla]
MLSYNFATISRLSRTFCRSYQRFPNKFIDTLKQELAKNKELQENKRQLEERLKKLSDSSVKEKYIKIQKESSASTELIKHQLNEFSDYVNKLAVSIKDSQIGQDAFKQLKAAAEVAEQVAKQVGDTQVYRQVANTASEIDKLADVRMYSKPEELRMRSDSFTSSFAQRHVEVNTDATQVELHKESRWYSGWKAFSESNPYYSKLLDWKMRIDESESIVFRGVRSTLERIQFAFTPQDDVSKVLTEISKVDPNFNKHDWLRFCEKEMIPNILEAVIQMNVNVLNDWCYERAFKMISQGINEYSKIGYNTFDSQIIDVSKVEMVSGKMMDQGPTLVITFQVFMIHVLKNSEGKVIEGDPNNAIRVHHVWVLCRDMEEFNPATAWKLLELHVQKGNLVL